MTDKDSSLRPLAQDLATTTAAPDDTSIPPGQTVDDGDMVGGTNSHDILHELFWYVCKGKEASGNSVELCVGDAIASLKREGILFWRDERFYESQRVALALMTGRQVHQEEEKASNTATTKKIQKKATLAQQEKAAQIPMDYAVFCQFVSPCARWFLKAFSEELVIPDWNKFTTDMTYHFEQVARFRDGQNAQYINILREVEPEQWGLSVCSIDGQRFSLGDALAKHTLQSVSKPVTYALGLAREGHEFMEQWIDCEPAGRPFNTQDLDPITQRPFNASVNTGAIMAAGVFASGFSPDTDWCQVVGQVRETWFELCGKDLPVGFSEETFVSEKETAYNNFAIAYNLKGRRGLPRDVDLQTMLNVYLGCCSIEITSEALAVAAATLANGGMCPITGQEIFPADIVRTVLAETMTCGMYNQAGIFAVQVGLPAKSGVSGALMVIVPNVFGFATFSPRLNAKGNSVRGIEFCRRLVGSYRVHVFEPLRSGNTGAKIDPRRNGWKDERIQISRMAWAVEVGDVYATRIRDIFLLALLQTAAASPEGLSERMLQAIRESYIQIYQAVVDENLLADLQAQVVQNSKDLQCLEELTQGVHIMDSMRSLIIMSVLDIVMIDGSVGEDERSVALRIAVMLGMDKDVALLELNRCEHHAGHHFKEYDPCTMIESMDADVAMRHSSIVGTSTDGTGSLGAIQEQSNTESKRGRQLIKTLLESTSAANEQDELLFLRKEVLRLRSKVGMLTNLLHEQRSGTYE